MSHRRCRAATEELLEQFRLFRRRAEVDELSGGMAQRLMVARAIMHEPQILFLDEPTAGLDPQSRIALWDVVRELHDRGQTILLTTHYMEEADQLCDRVAIMDRGRLLALDTPRASRRPSAPTPRCASSERRSRGARRTPRRARPTSTPAAIIDDTVHVYVGRAARHCPS